MELTEKDLARFWAKVDRAGEDECWLWTSTLRNGYGIFHLRGKTVSAHRIALSLYEDVANRFVRHSCDNLQCVNPNHLFLGAQKQNMDAMHPEHRAGRFSDEQILDIRSRPRTNTMVRDLAKEFSLTTGQVRDILDGTKYGWVPNAIVVPEQFRANKLTPEQLAEIQEALKNPSWGLQTRLAEKYNVTKDTISKISRGCHKYSALS